MKDFILVHSTHLDDDELKKLAASKANVVLCPFTEGNLGDGIFRMKEYVRLGGHWSIGTDSHIGFKSFRRIPDDRLSSAISYKSSKYF